MSHGGHTTTANYTASIANYSTTATSRVILTIEPTAGAAIDTGSIATTLGSCDTAVDVCTLGTLAAGQTATVTLSGSGNASGPALVTFSVMHADIDPVPGNDSTSI